MAILEMNKIYICGLNEQRKGIIEFLHRSEALEMADFDAEENEVQRKETAKSISKFDSYIAGAAQALQILNVHCPEKKGMFSKRETADQSRYSMDTTKIDVVNKTIYEIINSVKAIKDNEENISKINIKRAQLVPYMSLDVAMNFK